MNSVTQSFCRFDPVPVNRLANHLDLKFFQREIRDGRPCPR